MKRRGRQGFVPYPDAVYTVGPLIELRPEDDRTGNAARPAPPLPPGPAAAAAAGVIECLPEHDRVAGAARAAEPPKS